MGGYRVTSVQSLGKKKYKVIIEGTEAEVQMSLYPSEIRRYNIVEDAQISDLIYGELCDVLFKRGKERALYYLKTADKTKMQMRTKLKEGYYPIHVIESIIDFLEDYGYIDDYRYAQNFVNYNRQTKSVQRMKHDLTLKGINRNIIDEVILEILQETDSIEECQIESYCRRRIKQGMDEKQCNKIIMALMRKGFKYEQVRSVFRRVLEETTT